MTPSPGEEKNSMKNEQGFSLVELLIVVAIIAIIAAIAIPSLLTSKMAANEASGMQGCRTLGSAEIAFAATNNQNYTDLATLVTGNFVDSRFNNANGFNGYVYAPAAAIIGTTLAGAPPASFGFTATPSGTNGRYSYGIGPDQVVRFQATFNGASNPLGLVPGDPIGKAQ
jgi:prepilin-type N-terminal cleavage/methylation domain-containing protein